MAGMQFPQEFAHQRAQENIPMSPITHSHESTVMGERARVRGRDEGRELEEAVTKSRTHFDPLERKWAVVTMVGFCSRLDQRLCLWLCLMSACVHYMCKAI